MSRLLVHVEGQTEESFVNSVLAPHLYELGFSSVSARLLGNARQRSHRGGIRSWNAVRTDIVNHLKADRTTVATTMVDYYGLPNSWPGREDAVRLLTFEARAHAVEQAVSMDVCEFLGDDFDRRRFVPYVVMHEFEGLLFSDTRSLAQGMGRPSLSSELEAIRSQFNTPEEINDSPTTAPSSRILRLYAGYQKPLMGVLAAERIGLEAIRMQCPLFDVWLAQLEQRAVH